MTTVEPGVIETFESIERTGKNGCSIGASYQVMFCEPAVERLLIAAMEVSTTRPPICVRSSSVSGTARAWREAVIAEMIPAKSGTADALPVLPVNGMRMP